MLPEAKKVRCPECELFLVDSHEHRCGVPILTEAAGVELTPLEHSYTRWLAKWDRETVDVFAGLLRRCRVESLRLWLETEFKAAVLDDERVMEAAAMLTVARDSGDPALEMVRKMIAAFVRELIDPGAMDRETVVRDRKN